MASTTLKNIQRLAKLPSGNWLDSFRFTIAAGGTNETRITIQAVDAAGTNLTGAYNFNVMLSDAATGVGLTATTASGAVTTHTGGGTVIGTDTAKKALHVQTNASGNAIITITDTAKTGFYVVAVRPVDGKAVVSRQLVTADYA